MAADEGGVVSNNTASPLQTLFPLHSPRRLVVPSTRASRAAARRLLDEAAARAPVHPLRGEAAALHTVDTSRAHAALKSAQAPAVRRPRFSRPRSVAQQPALVFGPKPPSGGTHPWLRASVLVDSGSQQVPLVSESFAQALGVAKGPLSGVAAQADGSPVRLWQAGPMSLSVNGTLVNEQFRIAPIAPYDVILGEEWLYRQRGVLDYAGDALWMHQLGQGLKPLRLDVPPGSAGPGGAEASAAGGDWGQVHSIHSGIGARLYRSQRRHLHSAAWAHWASRPSVGDRWWAAHSEKAFGVASIPVARNPWRELPEDAVFEGGDIPGLIAEPQSSFDFVEREVRQYLSECSLAQVEAVLQRLRVFEPDVFETRTMPRIAPRRQLDLDITEVPGARPVARRPYPVAPHLLPELDRQISALLSAGIIRHSVSPYAAPVLFAPKKDGKLRLCTDYRMLNRQTVRDKFPTPTAKDLIARTQGARLLSKIDLHSGFHQLRIREEDCHKTAFLTPMGQYEYVTAPFGLSSTPSAFQRLMTFVLADHIRAGYCCVYIDDIVVWSKTDDPLDHLDKLEKVLASLREHELLAKGSKCELFRSELEFLGFLVGRDGVRPVPAKVAAVQAVPAPETVSHLRSFLGMANFFRHHIPSFADIAAPLNGLLKGTKRGSQRLKWSVDCETAFNLLKDTLTSAPLLRHFDPSLRTAVHLDASQHAVGAVLLQWAPGEEHPRPVCFLSRKLQGAQFHYDARNAEALAAQLALTEWRHYLYGVSFELYSDHASLGSLFTQKAPSQRLLRLCEFLSEFDFQEIRYVRGSENVVPDFLSRPWSPEVLDVGLHLLSHPRSPRANSLQRAAGHYGPTEVVLLVTCGTEVLTTSYGSLLSLPHGALGSAESEPEAVRRVLRGVGISEPPERVTACARVGRFGLWRVELGGTLPVVPAGVSWRPGAALPPRACWQRTVFELLPALGALGGRLCSLTSEVSTSLLQHIREEQQTDAFLSEVREGRAASGSEVWRDFFIHNDVICYQRPEDVGPRVCVPAAARQAVLHAAHGGDVLVGHPGIARTTAHVARYYYWPALHRDVAQFVRSCKACATSKSSSQRRLGTDAFSSVPVQPFSHWAMDLVGPMPKSRAGNEWVVTWVDRTSKMIVAAAAKTGASSGRHLADLTFKEICCRFGIPLKLTHDNDVRFKHLWRDIFRRVGTKISCTSAFNPQSDPAERANRQVLEALRAAVETVHQFEEWDQALPHVCFGLNNSVSSATGVSPFELAHGFPARTPLTVDVAPLVAPRGGGGGEEYALQLQNRWTAAADQVAAAGVRLGRQLAARATQAAVKVGDWVWLDGGPRVSQAAAKLAPRWFGPFQVLQVIGGGSTVRLDFTPAPHLGRLTDLVNLRRLKFFEARDAVFCDGDEAVAPRVGADGAERFEVSSIDGHRKAARGWDLFVRWKGFDSTWGTWVSEATMRQDVPTLVEAYWRHPSQWKPRPSAPKRATGRPVSAPLRRGPPRAARA